MYIFFEIQDTGIGISEEDKLKVFEKFYRVKKSAHLIDGSGLGLYISKKIALAHNGDIYVESEVGKGSKFTFYMPKK